MTQAEWALIVALTGTTGIAALASRLVWSIWVGRHLRPIPIAIPLGVALVAGALLAGSAPAHENTLVASAVSQGPLVASVVPPGALSELIGNDIQFVEHGERVTLRGSKTPGEDQSVWTVVEDIRTGTYWLQGPATSDGDQAWHLDLVIGPGDSMIPLPYRATVFAVPKESGVAWQEDAVDHQWLTLGALPPDSSWLAPTMVLGGGKADSRSLSTPI